MTPNESSRRGFLGRAFTFAGAAAFAPLALHPAKVPSEAWLAGLTGKHRQFFDCGHLLGGHALGRAANFLDVYGSAYGLTDRDIDIVFGMHGEAIPVALSDAAWSTYKLGEHFNITDPTTKAPATQNVFATGGRGWPDANTVEHLQKRGVRFLACHQSLRALATQLAGSGSKDEVLEHLRSLLLPGVYEVPAMIVATNRAQEAGLTYVVGA